ncbi:MAG: hypothetical protein F4053_00255 [Proteobacteria bacterium]|nr:hypothetical protein [Pseudomonadota bacterium]MYJ94074.1 hypothetical protein [Pseudomonadota bacterium]
MPRITQSLVIFHRWLGVSLCLFIAAWFASGIILIYVPFPALAPAERIASRTDIPLTEVRISPAAATAAAGPAATVDSIRLIARNDRPLYVVHRRGSSLVAVWADNGQPGDVANADEARRVAEEFSKLPVRRVEGPFEFDQWIVHQAFNEHRPFYRVSLDDDIGTQVYVSQRSGEIVQRTRRSERYWNYFGAVVHWIYPTVLRRHWAAWDQVVWWLSLAGIVVTAFGAWLGIDRMRLAKRAKKASLFPFRGWMRWHHILGVFGGIFVFTWILSGWLSMDHGRLLSVPDPQPVQMDRFRGIPLSVAAASTNLDFIRQIGESRELSIGAVGETPIIVRERVEGTRIFSPTESRLHDIASLPRDHILKAARHAWPGYEVTSIESIDANDTYTRLRNSRLPPSSVRLILDDEESTWIHVDAATGQILSIMDRSRRLNRWLFNGLHSLDFPGFTNRRPLWDIVILSLMGLGLAFSMTGVYLGYTRLRRKLRI